MSVAAYFIAQTRWFESGKEVGDWLASENELAEIIQQYFKCDISDLFDENR
jgi:hypothetical protein